MLTSVILHLVQSNWYWYIPVFSIYRQFIDPLYLSFRRYSTWNVTFSCLANWYVDTQVHWSFRQYKYELLLIVVLILSTHLRSHLIHLSITYACVFTDTNVHVDLLNKSHNAPRCSRNVRTHVHIFVTTWCIVWCIVCLMHCGIYKMGIFAMTWGGVRWVTKSRCQMKGFTNKTIPIQHILYTPCTNTFYVLKLLL